MRILLKLNKFEEELFISVIFFFCKNHIEKTSNQPACKALDVILGLKYKAYSN